jgi:hypothetical protein
VGSPLEELAVAGQEVGLVPRHPGKEVGEAGQVVPCGEAFRKLAGTHRPLEDVRDRLGHRAQVVVAQELEIVAFDDAPGKGLACGQRSTKEGEAEQGRAQGALPYTRAFHRDLQ